MRVPRLVVASVSIGLAVTAASCSSSTGPATAKGTAGVGGTASGSGGQSSGTGGRGSGGSAAGGIAGGIATGGSGGAAGNRGSAGNAGAAPAIGGSGGLGGVAGVGGAAGATGNLCTRTCPAGYTCGTANGLEACRAPSGIPLFTNVTVILMENTSLSTLQTAIDAGNAPNFAAIAHQYATASDYHGVAHPSLPNYIALTSGDSQGIRCDCQPVGSACSSLTCSFVSGNCGCSQDVSHIGDQLEAMNLGWAAFGEDMGTPCNLNDSGNYAVRHLPFLYYSDVQNDSARCAAHVVDLSLFDPTAPSSFNFIAPNLVHDMNVPNLGGAQNIPNGDGWIGPEVSAITSSTAFEKGGLLVVVWDEDDGSGGTTGTDDPIPLFVISPFAKQGGYVSPIHADHASLLATLEDGLNLPRLGNAIGVDPLRDFFPDK